MRKQGFSLIEVVLVVALVAVTFSGVMSLTKRIMQMEHVVKNDFIAQGLAREGAEIVKTIVRDNIRHSNSFYTDLVPNPASCVTRRIDYTMTQIEWGNRNQIIDVTGLQDPNSLLKMNSSSVFYNHGSGSPTVFSRIFYLCRESMGTQEIIRYTVQVYWQSYGKGHTSKVTGIAL